MTHIRGINCKLLNIFTFFPELSLLTRSISIERGKFKKLLQTATDENRRGWYLLSNHLAQLVDILEQHVVVRHGHTGKTRMLPSSCLTQPNWKVSLSLKVFTKKAQSR